MKMHEDEVPTDEAMVARLIADQFVQWTGRPISAVPSASTDNALFRLGDDLVVRMPRIEWAVDGVAKEQRWLPYLAPGLPVAVPEPVALGAPGQGYPWAWSIYRWLDGTPPTTGDERLATDLAEFLLALQGKDATAGPPADRGIPLQARDQGTREAIEALDGIIDIHAVTREWEAALAAPPWVRPGVWLHGDLAPGNLLLVDGRLSAVIDWGALGVGDPAVELVVAWNLLSPRAREVFRAALNVDEATWARGRGWALSIALIQLPYYLVTNPPLAASARHVIGELLAQSP